MRLVNVATPLDAVIGEVPVSVPPLAETEIEADEPVTTLFPLSSTFTTGWFASNAPAVAPTG